MRRLLVRQLGAALLMTAAGTACLSPVERGEQLYREGDRLSALEAWRLVPADDRDHERAARRVAEVEEEFERLVVRYKKRGEYFEARQRLAEAILDYRLALRLQPHDAATLWHVQDLARQLKSRKQTLAAEYRSALDADAVAQAGRALDELRRLDPFDAELETEERRLAVALGDELTRRLEAGRRGFAAGQYRAAQQAFRDVLEIDPDHESARGYLSYMAGLAPGLASTPGVIGFDPADGFASDAEIRAEGFYQNALAAERLNDPYSAIRHDVSALAANPSHAGARQHLDRIRDQLEAKVEYLVDAGRFAFRNEDLQAALEHWRHALLIEPGNQRTRAYIARAERQLENLERLRSDPDVAAAASRTP